MAEKLYLGLDQGSTRSKAVVIEATGKPVASFSKTVGSTQNGDTEFEQNPEELSSALTEIAKRALDEVGPVEAIGLSCQRSGVLAWDSTTLKKKSNLISWRDTRTKGAISQVDAQKVTDATSLLVSTGHYACAKFALLQNEFSNEKIRVGTLDSFLLAKLVGQRSFQTDHTMAGHSGLYDFSEAQWSEEFCLLFGVDKKRLPEICPTSNLFGHWRKIPVKAIMADRQAALFAVGGGSSLNTGTISSISVSTGSKRVRESGFVSGVSYSSNSPEGELESEYFLEGITNASGPPLHYLLKNSESASTLAELDELCECASGSVTAYAPMGGTATPEYLSDLPSVIVNWDKVSFSELARAVVESIGCFISRNLLILKSRGLLPKSIPTSGGLTEIPFLLQFIADCTDTELLLLDASEASAIGAALSAAPASIRKTYQGQKIGKTVKPASSNAKSKYQEWLALEEQLKKSGISEHMNILT